jgi:RimJ/RimL family protein N-acetyltransferase
MLQGNRVVLRAVEREDLPNYVQWLNDRTVLEYFGQYLPLSLAQEEKWYEAMLQDPSTCAFSIEYEGQHVGGAGFTQVDARQRNAEVGLFIGVPDLWDQGLGGDVTQTLLRYGFQHEGRWRQAEFRNGCYHDILWMSVLRDEWTG